MFKAKRIDNGQIYQILDTFFDELFHMTYFLIWDNDDWRWRPSDKFVPPNIDINVDKNKILEVKTIYGKR